VHRASVDRAALGIFSKAQIAKLPQTLRERYMEPFGTDYKVAPDLRRRLLFSVHDVLKDPPFMRLDLVSCRNLLIYLDEAAQDRVLSLFAFALRKDGFLFLGSSESLGASQDDFVTVDSQWRLFRKHTDRRQPTSFAFAPRPHHEDRVEGRRERRASRPPLTSLESERTRRQDRNMLLRRRAGDTHYPRPPRRAEMAGRQRPL